MAIGFTPISGLNLPDVGGLTQLFEKDCVEATKKNIRLFLQQLADPKQFLKINVSGAIKDQLSADTGVLGLFSQDFLEKYASDAAFAIVQATGAESVLKETLNTVYKWVNIAYMANNTIVFIMMKVVATNIVAQINRKIEREKAIQERLTALYNALALLAAGDPIYNKYLQTLREAASLIGQAKTKVQVVRGALHSSNTYLSRQYAEAQSLVGKAQTKIRPSTGGNPFTTPFYDPSGKNLKDAQDKGSGYALRLAGGNLIQAATSGYLPTTAEQTDNILAIPLITRDIIQKMRDYAALTTSINGMIATFIGGVGQIANALYAQMKQSSLDHLSLIIDDLDKLKKSIDEAMKLGADGRPKNPVQVTALAFKWSVQISTIVSKMKLLPDTALRNLKVQAEDIAVYEGAVAALKQLDNVSSGNAILEAKDAQEQIGNYERQMLTGLLLANSAVLENKVGTKALPLIATLISRNNLAIARDTQIRRILQSYVDHEFEGEREFSRLLSSISGLMKSAGMDRALDLWKTGDYVKFFNMNAKTASYVGAGLEAVALLKDCFTQEEERNRFTAFQRNLERRQDLLNIKIEFEFEKAIRFNLDVCKKGAAQAKDINLFQRLCSLATQAGLGSIFEALDGAVSIPE